MKTLSKEILEELKSVVSGKSLDAIFPPFVYLLVKGSFGLTMAVLASSILAFLFGLYRLTQKQNWFYALVGFIGVLTAGSLALIANNATNYFLPGIINNALILGLAIVSLVMDRPMAAYASHLTRGWSLSWFWLGSIKPAYREVTWIWTLFFLMRTGLQVFLFTQNDLTSLVWANTLLGLPITILILVLSYIYGIARLRALKGPGIEEYLNHLEPPYKGQTRGF